MVKTILATFGLKTSVGYLMIQQMKEIHANAGVVHEDDFMKEVLIAAIFPNWIFFFVGVMSFVLVLALKSVLKKEE
jgi:hypothetical protein